MKRLIIIGPLVLVLLVLLGGTAYFIKGLQDQLAGYREVGSLEQMQAFALENHDLKLSNQILQEKHKQFQQKFTAYRTEATNMLEHQAVRRLQMAPAALLPSTGPMVLAAHATQEQRENCQQITRLLDLEMALFGEFDPAAVMQKNKVCDSFIEGELLPLVRVRMLSLKATLGSEQGHLGAEVDDAFIEHRNLLQQWQVPVSEALDRQLEVRH